MLLLNQPKDENLGQRIKNLLESEDFEYDHFNFVVAYARKSGVMNILPSLNNFKSKGGKITGIVGIDQKNTSFEALTLINAIADELFIYHNENRSHTFHPKFYLFEKENVKSHFLLGSNNLTFGGLFSNYEISIEESLDCGSPNDLVIYKKLKNIIKSYSDIANDCCVRGTTAQIEDLLTREYIGKESDLKKESLKAYSQKKGKGRIFGAEKIDFPKSIVIDEKDEVSSEVSGVKSVETGFWKVLSANDVSTSSSPGQIIIPIRFKEFFPGFPEIAKTNKASQAAVFFNVIVEISKGKRKRINLARAIHYVPGQNHPRPNEELRFTFRNREIFNLLKEGDILEFKKADVGDVGFIIKIIPKASADYDALRRGKAKFDTL
jgi:HKD family nuclease